MATTPFRLLVRLFTRRFFENDLLAPDIDLRPSAIWLLAALAVPAWLWTVKSMVRFGLLATSGVDVVETASWFDKSLLLTLGMVNGAIVTILAWEALLVDRRDAMILGSAPLPPPLIVAAKAMAALRLFLAVAALNVPPLLLFGASVYGPFGAMLVLQAFFAHLVAVTSATVGTCLVMTAALVTVTSLFEGRWLRVMTVVVQAVVLIAVTGLVLGFQWAGMVAPAARAADASRLSWLACWPPVWFLGLYQQVLGADLGQVVFAPMATRALGMTAVAVFVCVPVTLLLWRRALRVLVIAAPGEAPSRSWSIAPRAPAWMAREPLDRALLQFLFTVVWRSPRHRLATLTAGGLVAALALEATLMLAARSDGARWLTEFAVPVLALLALLAVFRWLLTLPAELPASWVLGLVTPMSGRVVRRATHRVFLLFAVLPAAGLGSALSWWQGDVSSAMAHAVLLLLAGLVLVERALTRVTFVPFATEYLPGRSNLKARWPVHGVVLLVVMPVVAHIERALLEVPGRAFFIIAGLVAAVAALAAFRRRAGRDLLIADPGTGAEWTPVVLGLGYLAPAGEGR